MVELLKAAWEIICAIKWLFKKRQRALLVIDDDPNDAEMLAYMLKRLGYLSTIVNTAEAAVGLLAEHEYPLVFVDGRLPFMSGFEFISSLRKSNYKSHFVIVCGQADDVIQLQKSRYVGIILKPVTVEAVEDAINKTQM